MRLKQSFSVGMFLFAVMSLVRCSPAGMQTVTQTVENAEAVAQYKLLLSDCRAKGRDAGSYEVYAACADAVDHDLCARKSLRCSDAGVGDVR